MDRLPFTYSRDGEVFWARFVSGKERPVHEHWPGLTDSDAIEEIDAAQWYRLAIDSNNREEVAAYLRLAWQLLGDHEVVANAYYWTEDASKALAQAGTTVRWQFEADVEGRPGYAAVLGFTPGRSCVPSRPAPTDAHRSLRDKTLMFRISSVPELGALVRSVLGDAAGEISLFGTTEAGAHRIVARLGTGERPAMSDLLEGDDIFVSISVGVDLGYNDAIFVASRHPLQLVLEPVRISVERAIAEYEAAIGPYVSPAEALALMERLAGA